MKKFGIWVNGILLAIAVTSLVGVFAGLPLYARIWHFIHGNSVLCGGFRVPVPHGWWATRTKDGYAITTPSPAYTLGNREPVMIFLHLLPSAPAVGDTQWRHDVINRMERDGYRFRDIADFVTADGAPIACFESNATEPPGSYIICNVARQIVRKLVLP